MRAVTKKTLPAKSPKSFRLSDEAARLLSAIADKMGISLTSTLEIIIRDFAQRQGIK